MGGGVQERVKAAQMGPAPPGDTGLGPEPHSEES